MSFGRICGRLFGAPLLYDARKAEAVVQALGPRLVGAPIVVANGEGAVDHVAFAGGCPSAGVVGDSMGRFFDRRGVLPFDMIDGVAVIAIEGTLVHKGGFVGAASGETSYEGLQAQIGRARRADAVKGVVFEVDSFGGEVAGAFETAAMIRDLSLAKPTIAILTDFAYSAGYLMASQARQIVMPEFGGAGSIGVITLHADFSRSLEQDGIAVTILKSGRHKADGNPFEPLADGEASRIQKQIDAMRGRFAEAVAAGRGARLPKAAALATEAQAFDHAEALDLGLVDAVASPSAAFAAFLDEINRRS